MKQPAELGKAPPAVGTVPSATTQSAGLRAAGLNEIALAALDRQLNTGAPVQRLAALQLHASQPEGAASDHALPAPLRRGIEALAGRSMAGVRVHRNSSRPAALQAHAYAQGPNIYLGPGQDQHLPHEAWHVVQQAEGRVPVTGKLDSGIPVNADPALEHEADVMGARALSAGMRPASTPAEPAAQRAEAGPTSGGTAVQRALVTDADITGERGETYSWTSFRGERTEEDHGKASELGRGAKNQKGADWQSQITWNAIDPGSGEGTGVTAVIGPDHNLGSSPSVSGAKKRVDAFKALSGKSYIAGHLLTEKLGGPGNEARNLTAIPATANAKQSDDIEDLIRVNVNERGMWMHYKLEVDYTDRTALLTTKDEKARAVKARKLGAAGLEVTRYPPLSGTDYLAVVRYASALNASWYVFDEDGGQRTRTGSRSVTIAAPTQGADSAVTPLVKSGAGTHKPAGKTTIDPEELVLTTSTLLKHIVDARAPLVVRIAELRKNLEALEGSEDEAREAYAALLEEARTVGWQAGWNESYHSRLAARGLGAYPLRAELIRIEAYLDAYEQGRDAGEIAADTYIRGYDDGLEQGRQDLPARPESDDEEYIAGYDRAYPLGKQDGYYSAGRRYQYSGMALLQNIHEASHNVFAHPRGFSVVELTGDKRILSRVTWYQVQLLATGDFGFIEEIGSLFWMKRAWLNKGR